MLLYDRIDGQLEKMSLRLPIWGFPEKDSNRLFLISENCGESPLALKIPVQLQLPLVWNSGAA